MRHNINYMGLIDRVQKHNNNFIKETNNDTFNTIQYPVKNLDHRSMTSYFNVINKTDQKNLKQGNTYSTKLTSGINNQYKNK